MQRGKYLHLAAMAGMVAFAASAPRPAHAAPTPVTGATGWVQEDIGSPTPAGSATVDSKGVWSVSGGGHDIWDHEDDFHYAYQMVTGDATITTRYLSMQAGDPTWTKVGPMIRVDDSNESPHAEVVMTSGSGVVTQGRLQNEADSVNPGVAASGVTPDTQVMLREQRSGNDVSGFYSTDGKIWNALGQTYTLGFGAQALVGLAITSHQDGTAASAMLDNVTITPGVSLVSGIQSCAGDKAVMLAWAPFAGAVSYNVYRAAAGTTDFTKFARVNAQAVTGTSFTDADPMLVNDQQYTYLVTPVTMVNGKPVEGGAVAFQAGPTAIPLGTPPGFTYTNISEKPLGNPALNCPTTALGASYDPASGTILIRGSGNDIWNNADEVAFLNQPVSGNFQVVAEALTLPTNTSTWAKAGPMIRETLDAGSRDVYWCVTPGNGLAFQWRDTTDGAANWSGASELDATTLTVPIWLRMTRKGDDITAEYSTDGTTWQGAADSVETLTGLAKNVYAGLCISSHQEGLISQCSFKNLKIIPM